MIQSATPTRSQLIPLMTKWEDIGKKSQLGPVIVTLVAFFLMSMFGDTSTITIKIDGRTPGTVIDPRYWIYTSNFLILVAVYLSLVSLYFIYRLVGKEKPWWVLLSASLFTAYFLWLFQVQHDFVWLYDFFHYSLAGGEADSQLPFFQLFMRHFLGTGFFEEIVKALPLLILVILGNYMSPQLRAKIGIEEPLDGILIGAAAGGGFAFMETIGEYVPQFLVSLWMRFSLLLLHDVKPEQLSSVMSKLSPQDAYKLINSSKDILGTAPGVPGLMIRSLDLSFGHMAYSGYFGYFIGLAVLKPESRWKILLIGLVSAAIPHALWDSVLSLDIPPLTALVALLSYGVLAAAILKAREISPNRSVLQPSVIFGSFNPAPEPAPAPVTYAPSAPPPPAPTLYPAAYPAPVANLPPQPMKPANHLPAGTSNMRVGSRFLVIVPGLRLLEHQVPGLRAQTANGPVAEVTHNPNDPSVLGLTNLSYSVWQVTTANNTLREIQPGQTIKLAPGTRINFGATDGEVQ